MSQIPLNHMILHHRMIKVYRNLFSICFVQILLMHRGLVIFYVIDELFLGFLLCLNSSLLVILSTLYLKANIRISCIRFLQMYVASLLVLILENFECFLLISASIYFNINELLIYFLVYRILRHLL
jgi:hypothetical protein